MKLRNIMRIINGMRDAARRFPLSFLSACAVTSTGLMLVHKIGNTDDLTRLLVVFIFGFLLFGAIDLFCEQGNGRTKMRPIMSIAGIGLLVGYHAYLPADMDAIETSVILRSVAWGASLVFLVLCAPYIKKGIKDGSLMIWNFNALLIAAIALTGIWVVLAQGGIAIAISSINYLFNMGFTDRAYQNFVAILFGFFGPVFLLSRVPKNTEQVIETVDYPKELRLILQYVLVPLVSVYFLILYAYVIRIVVSGEWPVGTLAYMILGFSGLGMLVYTCLYPLRNSVAWIRKVGNMYHAVLIPQIGMLFWALWFRIVQYGITESRYYVLIAGLWLLAVSIYFLASKKKDLRVIPISIVLVALLSSVGPWSALTISERSQQGRMEGLMRKNKILIDGRVQAVNAKEVSSEDKKELGAITSYLIDTHGKDSFERFAITDIHGTDREEQKKQVMERFGLSYEESRLSAQKYFYYTAKTDTNSIRIDRFTYAITNQGMESEQTIGGVRYQFRVNTAKNVFEVVVNGAVIAQKDLNGLLDVLGKTDAKSIPKDAMIATFENDKVAFEYHIERINGETKEDGHMIEYIDGLLLFTVK